MHVLKFLARTLNVVIRLCSHFLSFLYQLHLEARWVQISLSFTSEEFARESETPDTMHARRTPFHLGQLPRSVNYCHV